MGHLHLGMEKTSPPSPSFSLSIATWEPRASRPWRKWRRHGRLQGISLSSFRSILSVFPPRLRCTVQHLSCHPGESSGVSPSSSQHLGQCSGGFGWRLKANSRNAEVQERQPDRPSHMTNQHLQGWTYGWCTWKANHDLNSLPDMPAMV